MLLKYAALAPSLSLRIALDATSICDRSLQHVYSMLAVPCSPSLRLARTHVRCPRRPAAAVPGSSSERLVMNIACVGVRHGRPARASDT